MELHLEQDGQHLIQTYTPGSITIDQVVYTHSLIVSPFLIEAWPPQHSVELNSTHLHRIIELTPEVFLLGTGTQAHFLPTTLLAELYQRQIGVEVMTTRAACSTYNVLVNEGRRVIAALLLA